MNMKNDDCLSVCGVHEPQHKSKTYRYLPSPCLVRTPHLIICCCLNVGVEPPGYRKPRVTSTVLSWINTKEHRKREVGYDITVQLWKQYQRYSAQPLSTDPLWDPTTERVKRACMAARERFGKDRVLFHYNGHGVPLPTVNHECWFFDENITTYVPMNISDVFACLGERAVYVFDCPYSERLFRFFHKRNEALKRQHKKQAEYIVFSGYGDMQPPQTNPDFPIDIFSACLTTPLSMALMDFYASEDSIVQLTPAFMKTLPIDHKTKTQPFSELYVILTSVIEAIAWNVLPPEMFTKLFRQDIMVASLFRHFILAQRVMKRFNFTPQSYPEIPDVSNHPLWRTWDSVVEMSVPRIINTGRQAAPSPSPYFSNLIVSLKSWLSTHPDHAPSLCTLPMVFRLFLRKEYTVEVFDLICEYVDLGFFACERVVNIGFLPLLIQSLDRDELQQFGVFCLAKIFSYDTTYVSHFLRGSVGTLLGVARNSTSNNKKVCALFLLAQLFSDGDALSHMDAHSFYDILFAMTRIDDYRVKVWALICFARLINHEQTKSFVYMLPQFLPMLSELSADPCPLVRGSVLYVMMYSITPPRVEYSQEILERFQAKIFELAKDGCPTVRSLLVVLLFKIISCGHQASKYNEILEYLSNDTDPDVIRCSESLLSMNEKSRGPFHKKVVNASPSGQYVKSSQLLFYDLLDRFYCSARDIFRRPLLVKFVNEEKEARREWREKQSATVHSCARDSYNDIDTKQLRESARVTLAPNTHNPHALVFHPSLPLLVTDTGRNTISLYEYSVSASSTTDFPNFNPINTSISYLNWLNKHDSVLMSGCEDGSVRLWSGWEEKQPQMISSWRGVTNEFVNDAHYAVLPNNTVGVASGNVVNVWEVRSEQCRASFTADSQVTCLSPFADTSFFYGCDDGTVRIVDTRDPAPFVNPICTSTHNKCLCNIRGGQVQNHQRWLQLAVLHCDSHQYRSSV